jgi:ribokinase
LRSYNLNSVYALVPNETEGRVCIGLEPDDPIPDADLAAALLDLGAENIILTLGAKGVLWASRTGIKAFPALKVQVVDSVGAGDAFNAGLAVGLSEKKSLPEAIAMGVTAASLSTQYRETIESYPYRDQVDARITEILDKIK